MQSPKKFLFYELFYESGANLKFVLTGSSSLLVADKVSESLLGRSDLLVVVVARFLTNKIPLKIQPGFQIIAIDRENMISLSRIFLSIARNKIFDERRFADSSRAVEHNHFLRGEQLPEVLDLFFEYTLAEFCQI